MALDLPHRLQQHIESARLFPDPGLALLAVSGGPDSVALLDLLSQVGPAVGLDIAVAHVDHGILPESPDVAEQVMALAVRFKVPGYLASLKLGPSASETRAREGRYRALWHLAGRVGARYLVTAHHADDQIETVLFRLLRGTGPAGLAGIAPSREDGLVRPLLLFRKGELSQWIDGRLAAHQDASNVDLSYERSWIRHELMAVLRDRFGPVVEDHLLAVSRHAAADRGAWSALLRELPGLDYHLQEGSVEVDRGPLLKYDKKLSEAVLRAMAHDVGCVLGPWRAARLRAFVERAQSGRTFEIGQGWLAEIAFARLRIFRMIETPAEPTCRTFVWDRNKGGRLGWGRWTFSWDREPAGDPLRVSFSTWIDGGPASVRVLASGDRIRPVGGVGRRRVSRLLMEGRVPRSQRAHYPIVYRDGEIIWVPGVCRGSSALPRPGELAVRLDASIS